MFFSRPGEYEACGIFTIGHFALMITTIIGIIIALKYTLNKKDVKKIIKNCTIFVWICEVIIISFKIAMHGTQDLNQYVPLYYCSLLLYAGGFSSFGKGRLKRAGDVFLATGAIAGGIIFILFPSTSLPTYPTLHLVSIHSFVFHGIMLYLGILVNWTQYVKLEKKDIIYYSSLVGIICAIAYIVNTIFGSNLMFISKNFPGTFIELMYNLTGKLFTPIMILAQMFIPFYAIYGIVQLINKKVSRGKVMEELFDVLNEKGEYIGKIESREKCHKEGLWHKAVALFIINSKGQVLLQKRSEKKKLWPNMWDITGGGHVLAGEFGFQAIIREMKEELGIELEKNDITFIGSAISTNIKGDVINNHFNEYYIVNKDVDETRLKLDPEEVSEVTWVDKNEIIKRIKNNFDGITDKEGCWEYLVKYYEWADANK